MKFVVLSGWVGLGKAGGFASSRSLWWCKPDEIPGWVGDTGLVVEDFPGLLSDPPAHKTTPANLEGRRYSNEGFALAHHTLFPLELYSDQIGPSRKRGESGGAELGLV